LIEPGKLRIEAGKITNRRAMIELGKALKRIDDAGNASRIAQSNRASEAERLANDLRKRAENFNEGRDINDLGSSVDTPKGSTQPPTIKSSSPSTSSVTTDTESRGESRAPRASRSRQGTKHKIAEDWKPTDADLEWALVTKGFDDQRVEQATEKFRNHFLAEGNRKANWSRAWRNWQLNDNDPDHWSNRGRNDKHHTNGSQGSRGSNGGAPTIDEGVDAPFFSRPFRA
jgi:hypothetical protein